MSLKPQEEIGMEVHPENDQFSDLKKVKVKLLLMAMSTKLKMVLQ